MPPSVRTTTSLPTQSPRRTYSGMTSLVRNTPATEAASLSLVAAYDRPSGSTNSEMPELAARATPMRVSIVRSTRWEACCAGALVLPNQASLVTLMKKSAPCARYSRAASSNADS